MFGQAASHHLGGGYDSYESMSDAPDPRLVNMPKGTLPTHFATSRHGGMYDPERVVVRDTRRGVLWNPGNAVVPRPSSAQQFYTPENRRVIVRAALDLLDSGKHSASVTEDQVPATMVTDAMQWAYEIGGDSAANAPQARTGPSESLAILPPRRAYRHVQVDTPSAEDVSRVQANDVLRLNMLALNKLAQDIETEIALAQRYQHEASGAIHVLDNPRAADDAGNQFMQSPYYDSITSEPGTGTSSLTMFGPAYGSKRS